MSLTTDLEPDLPAVAAPVRSVPRAVLAVLAASLLAIAVAAGYLWGSSGTSTGVTLPTASSVDAGFARDMSVHHQQAITMAVYAENHSDSPAIKSLAYDIESSQTQQLGEMTGWLDEWGVSPTGGTRMSWMPGMASMVGPGGLMPGMATPAQMNRLLSSHGKTLDVLFLQLMIHHHQGGVAMAQYASHHAATAVVRQLAGNMAGLQTQEIVSMQQMLQGYGASALPPPA